MIVKSQNISQKKEEGMYEYVQMEQSRFQICPICKTEMGDMPGSRDAYCSNCGYKDPCCE